ncbi:MAG: class I SAM-dependent methyltransferase [Polyangiaceae bacterium]|nr:class I SAM-dependent methyltransferase [Polyangiaceae bacterium]
MDRIPEPELMNGAAQAHAYAEADFEGPNSAFCGFVEQRVPFLAVDAQIVDLGCGPGDITLRLARRFPDCRVDGVDGAPAMLDHARAAHARSGLGDRVRWITATLPCPDLGRSSYDLVVSNSLLHHLPDPMALWDTVSALARPGATAVVMDLVRPESDVRARELVETYSGSEPPVLKTDFYHSLRAAYRVEEVRAQLVTAGLELQAELVSDRHLLVWGRCREGRGTAG